MEVKVNILTTAITEALIEMLIPNNEERESYEKDTNSVVYNEEADTLYEQCFNIIEKTILNHMKRVN